MKHSSQLLTLAAWFLPALIFSIAVARFSVWFQSAGFASPLLPVVMGAALGGIVFGLAQFAGDSRRGALLVGTLGLALACSAAEHGFFYVDYCRKLGNEAELNPQLQILQAGGIGQPLSLAEFLAASSRRTSGFVPGWVWWIVHAALLAAAALTTVWWLTKVYPPETVAKPQAAPNPDP